SGATTRAHSRAPDPVSVRLLQGVRGQFRRHREDGGGRQRGAAEPPDLRRQGPVEGASVARAERPLLRHGHTHTGRHRGARRRAGGGRTGMTNPAKLRRYHSAVWDEPVIFEMGYPGRRATVFSEADGSDPSGKADALIPARMRRRTSPGLAELSEHEVL